MVNITRRNILTEGWGEIRVMRSHVPAS
uniref:Uncharacterized protein n=1 Tax=Anguilla anguilla TaxID=7936 RepID=A0A0E9TC97_ANGAN